MIDPIADNVFDSVRTVVDRDDTLGGERSLVKRKS
jgi:hypothetical protein